MAGKIIARVADGARMFARVRFTSGEQVMVSMTVTEVVLFKMLWGVIPVKQLARLEPLPLIEQWDLYAGHTPLSRSVAILDRVTAAVLACNSAAEAQSTVSRLGINYQP